MKHLPPRFLTVHASATYPSMDIGKTEIDQWHRDRGWNGIGYHFVIRRDGTVETGRPVHRVGAHVGNHNTGNIGICMVGGLKQGTKNTPEDNYTSDQWTALNQLLTELHERWPDAKLMGHNDFRGHETRGCPCFNQKIYFAWLHTAWQSKARPSDWSDYSKYNWHNSSLLSWEVPTHFYDEIDIGGLKD